MRRRHWAILVGGLFVIFYCLLLAFGKDSPGTDVTTAAALVFFVVGGAFMIWVVFIIVGLPVARIVENVRAWWRARKERRSQAR